MTAYEQGFMDKCAELGVDPRVLVKRAGLLHVLGADSRPATAAVRRGAKRLWELLRGGNPLVRKNHSAAMSILDDAKRSIEYWGSAPQYSPAEARAVARKVIDRLNPLGTEVTDPMRYFIRQAGDRSGNIIPNFALAFDGSAAGVNRYLEEELGKVVAARLGTAAGVGGAGYGAYKAVSGKKDK